MWILFNANDRFFATTGGGNTITGNLGSDQFWIADGGIPEEANIITDFTSGEDVIGIAGLGIGYSDLSITDNGEGGAVISADGSELVVVTNTSAHFLANEEHFAFA